MIRPVEEKRLEPRLMSEDDPKYLKSRENGDNKKIWMDFFKRFVPGHQTKKLKEIKDMIRKEFISNEVDAEVAEVVRKNDLTRITNRKVEA